MTTELTNQLKNSVPFAPCPICDNPDTHYRNIGRGHWFVCDVCQIRWLAGSNLFSSWREETEEDWKKNFEYLSQFKEFDADESPFHIQKNRYWQGELTFEELRTELARIDLSFLGPFLGVGRIIPEMTNEQLADIAAELIAEAKRRGEHLE